MQNTFGPFGAFSWGKSLLKFPKQESRSGLWKIGTGLRRHQATPDLLLDGVQQGLVSEDD